MLVTLLPHHHASMKRKLYWLAFKKEGDYWLSPYRAETRQDALRHGMEHILNGELVAVFSEDAGLTVEKMLDLATVGLHPDSLLWRHE